MRITGNACHILAMQVHDQGMSMMYSLLKIGFS